MRTVAGYVGMAMGLMLMVLLIAQVSAVESSTTYYVSSTGSDTNAGTESQPLKTIQHALSVAQPGDTVQLKAETYKENIKSVRDGQAGKPITIKGVAGTVLKSGGTSNKIFEINHDYIHVTGFTIDGLKQGGNARSDYEDKLLYVQGKDAGGIEGLKVLNMTLKNSGGEAMRLRYFIKNAEVAYNTFENVGVYDFKFGDGGKNGEAIYLGTSSNQWADGKNPTSGPDGSTDNIIHHNYFNTQGNECVDIKEGAYNNIVEYNVCTGQKDPNSGGLDSRSDKNIFRYNKIYKNLGAGVRIGGHTMKGHLYGQGNEVYGNEIYDNAAGGIKYVETGPNMQGKICQNTMSSNAKGNSAGTNAAGFDPTKACTIGTTESTGA